MPTRNRKLFNVGADNYVEGVVLIDKDGNPIGGSEPLPVQSSSIPTEWIETAFASGADTIATRAAVAGESHYITGIEISYEVALANGIRCQLQRGTGNTHVISFIVLQVRIITFPSPILIPAGEQIRLIASNGGISVDTSVSILGYTRP